MFSKHWETAEGTIVASTFTTEPVQHHFVVDVQPAGGAPVFRATCSGPHGGVMKVPNVGAVVPVLCDAKHRKVKFDLDDPAFQLFPGAAGQVQADRAKFDAERKAGPGSASPAG